MTLALREVSGALQFPCKAVPGASRDRVVGLYGEALKVAVSAPPEGGKANERICAVVAQFLEVPPRAVWVVAGHASARKTLQVAGVARERLLELVRALA